MASIGNYREIKLIGIFTAPPRIRIQSIFKNEISKQQFLTRENGISFGLRSPTQVLLTNLPVRWSSGPLCPPWGSASP